MNELQYGMIGFAAMAIVGVLAYNKWQEHKHRKLAEQVLKARHDDVLLEPGAAGAMSGGAGEERGEGLSPSFPPPVIAASGEDGAESVDRFGSDARAPASPDASDDVPAAAGRIEPVFTLDPRLDAAPSDEIVRPHPPEDEAVADAAAAAAASPGEAPEAPAMASASPVPASLLSPAVDFIAAFETVEPAPAYQILEAQQSALARVRKPIHWIGYNERTREWEPVIDDGASEYRRLRVALQLVDRQGPASDGDLSVFTRAMQDLSDELMAVADLPSRQPAQAAAIELDRFCAGVDIQIGINVVAQGQSFAGTKLRALAEAAGMALDEAGRFVRRDDEGNVLYVLLNQEAPGFSPETMKTMQTHGITFLLDVPRVAHGDRVFNQMVDLARRFADALHGELVDDNRRPLSEGALEPIRRQVAQFQAAMAARQIPAGGPLALRLFA